MATRVMTDEDYRKNADRVAAWTAEAKKDPNYRARRTQIEIASRKRNADRNAARRAVHEALRKGKLTRPDFCQWCTEPCRPEASHDDYSKPLLVTFLCIPCHRRKDRGYTTVRSAS